MFPLKIANNYQQPSSSIWQPLLETLRERKHVHCFEYMGGMHPENLQVAQDFWEEHYDTDGYKIFNIGCLLYTSPSPRDRQKSRMPSSA